MKVSKAVQLWLDYHKANSRKNTVQTYEGTISKFVHAFGGAEIAAINTEDVQSFLDNLTEGRKQQTKKIRYSHVKAFYSFTKANLMPGLENPCDNSMMKKLFRAKPQTRWDILEKETVDEIIFRTAKVRNRLILELMARGAMRIGEVLKLTHVDINGRKLILRAPKSGKEHEFVVTIQRVLNYFLIFA
jgi:integrase/recombinase XerD